MERGALDLVQVNYSISNRGAEERVLPLPADRGIGVLVNMPPRSPDETYQGTIRQAPADVLARSDG